MIWFRVASADQCAGDSLQHELALRREINLSRLKFDLISSVLEIAFEMKLMEVSQI